ncbi:MAG: FumA C-terminus/TtdB family hydratase beta subunit [Solirubrobacterales bacterium]
MAVHYLQPPLSDDDIRKLRVDDLVYLTGRIFTARDQAHLRIRQHKEAVIPMEEDLSGSVVFHAGPTIVKDEAGYRLVAIGPTTSIRMEPYSDMMGALGVKALVGKGGMGDETTRAAQAHGMVYLIAAHGCSAIHVSKIKNVLRQHWMEEFGMPEALWVMECERFGPLIVGIDAHGRNLFEEIKEQARLKIEASYPAAKG